MATMKRCDYKLMKYEYEPNLKELRVGYDRYEKLRRMSPRDFTYFYTKSLLGKKSFDEMVDEWTDSDYGLHDGDGEGH